MSFPPLVAPATDLSAHEVERQAHQLILAGHGSAGQRRLAVGKVLVIGADEIGAPLLAHLADSGVGVIGIADGSALNPWDRYLGIPDPEPAGRGAAWARALDRTYPSLTVAPIETRFDLDSAEAMVSGYDIVVCGAEDPARCQLADDVCAAAGIPLVWGSMRGVQGQVSVFWDAHGPGLRDLFQEPPTAYFRGMAGSLKLVGSWLAVVMATEVTKLLTGTGEPLVGRVMTYDALAATCTVERVDRVPGARRPAKLAAAPPFYGLLSPEAAEAARESTISVEDLKKILDSGEPIALVDVREPEEYDFAHIAGSVLIPKGEFMNAGAASRLPRDRRAVLLCRVGIRSAEVLAVVKKSGHPDAVHVGGGMVAWTERIDTSLPAY